MEQEIVKNLCYVFWEIISSAELLRLLPSSSQPSAVQYSSVVLCIVTCIIGLPANIIVIFVTGFLMKKNKYKIWFLNLALADFTFLLFLPLHAISVLRVSWPYGSVVCKVYNFLTFVNMYAGICILTALNIDRALSVAKPIWHRRFHSWRFCWCMCAAIWVSSIVCSTPAIIYSDVHDKKQCSLFYSDSTHLEDIFIQFLYYDSVKIHFLPWKNCTNVLEYYEMPGRIQYVSEWKELLSTAVLLVVPLAVIGYVIPLGVILFSNIIIALHVKNSKMAASSRLYRVVIVAVMSFFCSKTPYVLTFITFLVSLSNMKFTLMYKLSLILPLLFSIAATNSLLNPVVYVLVGAEVRNEIVHFVRKKCTTRIR